MGDKVITDKNNYSSIATAIRYKNGTTTQYKPSEMAAAIKALTGSGAANPKLQSKTVTPLKSRQEVTYDSNYDGLEKVTVESIPSNYIEPNGTKTITENGSYDVTTYASADVNVPGIDTSDADATATDIKSGKTAYVNGEKITGSHVCNGVDTTDATATANNIEENYTAYVNNEKVTGSLASGNVSNLLANSSTYSNDGTPKYASASGSGSVDQPDRISISFTNNTKKIVKNGATVTASAKATLFGDAIAEDVLAGKTFTSVAGLKVVGTGVAQSGGMQKTTGTITNSKIIETGLSNIKSLIIYKSTVSAKGFVTGFYDEDVGKVTYVYCSSYSSYTKNYNYSSNTTFTMDGGTFTWNYGFAESSDEDTSNMGFTSNAEYKWVAYGNA